MIKFIQCIELLFLHQYDPGSARSALAQGLVKGLDNGFEQVLEDGVAASPDLDGVGHARLQAGTVTLNPERDAVIAEHVSEKLVQPLAA